MIFFNGPIRSALELFYPTLILSLMTLMHDKGTRSTMVSAGFKVAICVSLVPFSLNFIMKNEPLKEDRNFHIKYGAFFYQRREIQ